MFVVCLHCEIVYARWSDRIPVDFRNPTDQDFEKFCFAIARVQGCSGTRPLHRQLRVSAFFYRYGRDVLGMDEAERYAPRWGGDPEGGWTTFVGR